MIFLRPQRVYKPSSSSEGRLDNESLLDPSSYGKYHIIAEATRGTVFNDKIGLLTFVAHIYNDNGEEITALLQEKGFAPVWKLDKATVARDLLTNQGYTLKLTSRAMPSYFASLVLEARDTDILLSLVAPDLRQGIQRLIEEGAIPSTLLTHEHTIIHQLNLVQIADEKISESKKELLTKLAGKLSPEDLAKKLGEYATNTSVAQKLQEKQDKGDYATNSSVAQKLQENAAKFDSFVADTALRFDQLTTDTAQQFDQLTTDIQDQTEAQRAILAEQWRKTQKMHEDSERNIQAQYKAIATNYLRIGALSTNNIRSNSSKNGGGRIMLSPSISTIFIRRNNPTGICQFVVRVEQLVNAPLGSTWTFYNFPQSGASIYVAQPSSSLGYYAYMKSWDDRSSLGFVMEEGYKYEMTKTWNPLEFSIARIKLD